jgi:quercetin dioxygenase-like cupin family protein
MTDCTKPVSTLRQPHRYVTGHDSATGKAIVKTQNDFPWRAYDHDQLAFSVAYTTSTFPPDLNDDADVSAHERLVGGGPSGEGSSRLGLVNPKGTVLRCVDFGPGYACEMHRTQSLDYGIVLEGEVDMVLDSGERYVLKRGDVAVQRATQHQWVNRSDSEWARMMFVLQDCKPLFVDGKEMKEDLGKIGPDVPPSGN